MIRKRINGGVFVSIGLHIVIMIIPLTTIVVRESDEIELYVINEKPVIKEQKIIECPQMTIVSKNVEQEVEKKPIILPMSPIIEEKKAVNQMVIEPEKEIFRIRADRDVRVGFMVSVIDEVQLSGIKTFSIVTERR